MVVGDGLALSKGQGKYGRPGIQCVVLMWGGEIGGPAQSARIDGRGGSAARTA
ncbi:hypothetical protein GCM10027456_02490 [Kineosporia babensis]